MKKIYAGKVILNLMMRIFLFPTRNSIFLSFFICLFAALCTIPNVSAQYLQAEGTKILDKNGEEIILRGIGLGGWMLQEGYMLRTSGPQHTIEARVEDLIGVEKKQDFYEAWWANHTRKIDIDSMAAWGYNSVRLPMHYKLFTLPIEEEPVAGENTWFQKGFEMTDMLLEWVKANNMYLILDLHAAPGGQGEDANISDYDPTKPSLWESEANQEKMVALWKKLAERYASEPNIGAYDIINEPNWGFQNHEDDRHGCSENQNTQLWSLQKRITEAIREVDQNHIVIIEGNCWGNNYAGLPALWDENIVISYHKYWNSNSLSSIQGMINMREQRGVPIWLGETGENSNTWFTDAITLFEGNDIGWSWWPLKKLGMNNPLEIKTNSGYQEILDYWSGNGAKPSQEDAYNALMQLTEDLKLENNVYHRDVVDAMIRQPHSTEALPFKENKIFANATSRIFATDFDLGRHDIAYHDNEVTNETGNAGGLTWNQGYSYRNDGVDIEPCSDVITNGYNVGWTADGEWLQYTLDVDSTGVYQVGVRYAAQNDGSEIKIRVNDADQSAPVVLPATGGYQAWKTFTIHDIILYKGAQRFRLFIEKGGFNFNYIELTLKKKTSELIFKPVSGETSETGEEIYLTLNKKIDPSTSENSVFTCAVNDKKINITGATADPENENKIIIKIQEELSDTDEIRLSYSGDQIKATDGTILEQFTDLEIKNNVPIHFKLPGKLEAEDFNANSGLQLETTTDAGGGENIGYTNVGDYLDYLIFVEEEGEYKVEVRTACNSQAGILEFQQLTKDEEVLNGKQVNVPVTGGWQIWQTVNAKMNFDAGRGILRVKIVQPEFNINWYRFTKIGVVNRLDDNQQGSLKVYPNPTNKYLTIEVPRGDFSINNSLSIRGINGSMIYQEAQLQSGELEKLELSELPSGLYLMELSMEDKTWRQKFVVNKTGF